MPTRVDDDLIILTKRLLDCITAGDWETYQTLCDASLSAFEPEARGHLVEGMAFHRFYFELERPKRAPQTSMLAPHVRYLGDDVAVVSYIRLIQHCDHDDGRPRTACFEETRVWHRQAGEWKHVHFHRSGS